MHIFLGGKASKEAKEARIIAKKTTMKKAKEITKKLVLLYKNQRIKNESFEAYETRVLSQLSIQDIQKTLGL